LYRKDYRPTVFHLLSTCTHQLHAFLHIFMSLADDGKQW